MRLFVSNRTKWKRQTAVGLEILAEAGNYSALQRMFPSPYFYPQSLVSNLDPGPGLYLYRGPSAPPPPVQRPLVPRILLHGLQGGGEPASLPGVIPRHTPRWTDLTWQKTPTSGTTGLRLDNTHVYWTYKSAIIDFSNDSDQKVNANYLLNFNMQK